MTNAERRTTRPLRWAMVGGGRGSQIGYIHRSAALRDRTFDSWRAPSISIRTVARPSGQSSVSIRGAATPITRPCSPARRPDRTASRPCPSRRPTTPISRSAGRRWSMASTWSARSRSASRWPKQRNSSASPSSTAGSSASPMAIRAMGRSSRPGPWSRAANSARSVSSTFSSPTASHSAAVELDNPAVRWRVDPRFAGRASYVLGDLATHPLYISGGHLPRAEDQAPTLHAPELREKSRPARGQRHDPYGIRGRRLRNLVDQRRQRRARSIARRCGIVGSRASLEWWDERPNQLSFEVQGEPARVLERGMSYLHPEALADDHISVGHPEGLFEAWANLYGRFAQAMEATDRGDTDRVAGLALPRHRGRRRRGALGRELRPFGRCGRCLGRLSLDEGQELSDGRIRPKQKRTLRTDPVRDWAAQDGMNDVFVMIEKRADHPSGDDRRRVRVITPGAASTRARDRCGSARSVSDQP